MRHSDRSKTVQMVDGIQRIVAKAKERNISIPEHLLKVDPSTLVSTHLIDDSLGILTRQQEDEFCTLTSLQDSILQTPVGQAMLNHISDMNVIYIQKLLNYQRVTPQWHIIEYTNKWPFTLFNYVECAQSKSRCINQLNELASEELQYTTAQSNECEVFLGRDLIARVTPLEFPVEEGPYPFKVEQALSNITAQSDGTSIAKELKVIPDFKQIMGTNKELGPKNHACLPSPKSIMKAVKRGFQYVGVNITVSDAYELLAAFANQSDWNRLSSIEKKTRNTNITPTVFTSTNQGKTINKYYQSIPMGIADCHLQLGEGTHLDVELVNGCTSFTFLKYNEGYNPPRRAPDPYIHDGVAGLSAIHQIDLYEQLT